MWEKIQVSTFFWGSFKLAENHLNSRKNHGFFHCLLSENRCVSWCGRQREQPVGFGLRMKYIPIIPSPSIGILRCYNGYIKILGFTKFQYLEGKCLSKFHAFAEVCRSFCSWGTGGLPKSQSNRRQNAKECSPTVVGGGVDPRNGMLKVEVCSHGVLFVVKVDSANGALALLVWFPVVLDSDFGSPGFPRDLWLKDNLAVDDFGNSPILLDV